VVSLLIVACPCALALATPLALAVAIGRLARHRVLIREGDCLERIATPGKIFFDKTGTLTEGRMRVTEWNGELEPLAAVAAIEKSINHPIAQAVCQYADQHHAELRDAVDVYQTVGQGVSGIVDGAQYVIGGARVARDRGVCVGPHWQQWVERIRSLGASPILVIREDQIVAVFGVADPLRSAAADVVHYYRSRGWRIGIVSGDDQQTVDHVARQLDIDPQLALGELLPDEKLRVIEAASGEEPVVMVGDGVNDAAALAAADVGIAISGGAAASLSAAPVMIGDGSLQRIKMLADVAVRTRDGIRQNFAISIGYNVIAVMLAMMGAITPLLAALLMPISSVTVLALTLARPTFNETTP
jgi:Cu2+-exporting ATPase